jgi:hypothetical protein
VHDLDRILDRHDVGATRPVDEADQAAIVVVLPRPSDR